MTPPHGSGRANSTTGLDLAAESTRTALAVLEWSETGATVRDLIVGVDDDHLVTAVHGSARTGVDCPIGWPAPFLELVTRHAEGTLEPPLSSGKDWRRTLALRTTDLDVRAHDGLMPLSVAADRIAHPAMRWAAVSARLGADGLDMRRDGTGRCVEVYPAGALRSWGLPHRGYKGTKNLPALRSLVDALSAAAPWLDPGGHEDLMRRSDDAADAVIAAVVARAVDCGRYRRPAAEQQEAAAVEGWICMPTTGPGDLLG